MTPSELLLERWALGAALDSTRRYDLSSWWPKFIPAGHAHDFESVIVRTSYGAQRTEEHCRCGAIRGTA